MERLTEYHCGIAVIKDKNKLFEAMQKLAAYEDAEEKGLLLKLPCKVGTTVYGLDTQYWIDSKGCKDCVYYFNTLVEAGCDCSEDYPACMKVFETKFNLNVVDDIGKTMFLTKEEAEQKLEELKAGGSSENT